MVHSCLMFRCSSVSNDTSLNGLGFFLHGIALLVFQRSYHAIFLYGEQLRTEFVSINLQILIILNSLGLQCRIRKTLVKLHLSLHTNKYTKLIYYLISVLIIHIKTLYSFVTPTCFDTLCVIIREHTFFRAKITD
jgi:hypothetical protein